MNKSFKNSAGRTIKVGMEVKLTGAAFRSHTCPEGRENNKTAEVWSIGDGGELHLSRDLKGCRHWNADDVLPAGESEITVEKARDQRVRVAAQADCNDRLQVLMRWVNHDSSCSVRHGDFESAKCTCGLNKKLKEFGLA